jgi:TrmH family RNA methyltransferase
VLGAATVHRSLQSAVADCGLIVGTTARNRELPWRIDEPRSVASELVQLAEVSDVAILFGSERTGLVNAELEQCQRLITIPSSADYSSLNLAMAVQIVAYELWLARGARLTEQARTVPLASGSDMEKFYDHLVGVLDEIDFRDRTGEGYLLARLRQLFNRAAPDQNEINILRGILTRCRAGDAAPAIPTTVRSRARRDTDGLSRQRRDHGRRSARRRGDAALSCRRCGLRQRGSDQSSGGACRARPGRARARGRGRSRQ